MEPWLVLDSNTTVAEQGSMIQDYRKMIRRIKYPPLKSSTSNNMHVIRNSVLIMREMEASNKALIRD